MLLIAAERHLAQLTPENVAEIESAEPLDWTAYLTGSASGWICRICAPGVPGSWAVTSRKHHPMVAFRQARYHPRRLEYPERETVRWRDTDVEVVDA